jgi:hypothetical protein
VIRAVYACQACAAPIGDPGRKLYCAEPGEPQLVVRQDLRDYRLIDYWQDTGRPFCTVCVSLKLLTFFVLAACGPGVYGASVPPAVAARLSSWFAAFEPPPAPQS